MSTTDTTESCIPPRTEPACLNPPADTAMESGGGPPHTPRSRRPSGVTCPDCGSSMTPECGCWLCHHCGCSHCG